MFDFTAINRLINPSSETTAGCTSGGGLVATPDNQMLVHSIMGREPDQGGGYMVGGAEPFPGAIVLLGIQKLIGSGTDVQCTIDTAAEVFKGGAETDCPTIADIHVVEDPTSGGPHFFSLDFPNGGDRLAFFNYFVSETGIAGDLQVCMLHIQDRQLALNRRFPAAAEGQEAETGCISFNRADWPEDRGVGAGPAKPHYGLFRNTR